MNDHDRDTRDKTPTDEELIHLAAGNQKAGGTRYGHGVLPALGIGSQTLDRTPAKDIVRVRYRFIWIFVAGALVAAALAVFGLEHKANYSLGFLGSSRTGALGLKSEIATGLLGLGLFQLFLALWMLGRLPGMGTAAHPVGRVHRIAGMLLFLVTLPVAVHCMLAYGVKVSSARATVHSLAGCFFYGAFVSKILVVRSRTLPGWALPIAGGLLIAGIGLLWYSSALWFFNGYHLPLG